MPRLSGPGSCLCVGTSRGSLPEAGAEVSDSSSGSSRGCPADPSVVLYFRIYSWWILVQCWRTLRFSDPRGLRPADVLMDSDGFVARLTWSKTIGSDRADEVGRNL